MAYHISTKLNKPFNDVLSDVTESLKRQGFGIITTIDMKQTLMEKIKVDFRDYKILGACNPQFAHKALGLEPHIGVMLPCNIVVQQHNDGSVEVSAINPMETMEHVSSGLEEIAHEVTERLTAAVNDLQKEIPEQREK